MDDLVRVHGLHAARDASEQCDDRGVRGEAALAHLRLELGMGLGLGLGLGVGVRLGSGSGLGSGLD